MLEVLDRLFARVEAAIARVREQQRAGVRAELAIEALRVAWHELMTSPALGLLVQAMQEVILQSLDDEAFSPCAAADPAHEVLGILEGLDRAAGELLGLRHDERFALRVRPLDQIGLTRRVRAFDLVENLAYLTGLLLSMARNNQYAVDKLTRARDPRRVLVPEQTAQEMPALDLDHNAILPLPARAYGSETAQVRDLRERCILLGGQLRRAAETGRKRLREASLDDKAFSPNVVKGQSLALTVVIADTLKHAAELASLACQPVGNRASRE